MTRLRLALVGGAAVFGVAVAGTTFIGGTAEPNQAQIERKVSESICGKGSKVTVVCKPKGDGDWACRAGRSSTVPVTVKDGTVVDPPVCAL